MGATAFARRIDYLAKIPVDKHAALDVRSFAVDNHDVP
jgi:hypothetical protein